MRKPPFEKFKGFIKQLNLEDLNKTERVLFDFLFPKFRGSDDPELAYREAINHPLYEAFKPTSNYRQPERSQRRFGGFGLPRGRYYTVANNQFGHDYDTLSHELRAYRNPVISGMVEVFDNGLGKEMFFGEKVITIEPEKSLTIIIHNTELLPKTTTQLKFSEITNNLSDTIYTYRFPYRVIEIELENVLDLRLKKVRDWFYDFFYMPDMYNGAVAKQSLDEYPHNTIALSRYHLIDGIPPTPKNFWEMLPTLMNPDLGGGTFGSVGSTMFWLGEWMKFNDVNALIYPSARCDVSVYLENFKIKEFKGWCLINYVGAQQVISNSINFIPRTFAHSAWAWKNFLHGVQLFVAV